MNFVSLFFSLLENWSTKSNLMDKLQLAVDFLVRIMVYVTLMGKFLVVYALHFCMNSECVELVGKIS